MITTVEMMIHALSKEIREGELSAVGTLSPIPAAACYLAKMNHAPQARIAILDSPEWPFNGELEELFNMAQAGRVGLFFLSGAQIDRQANLNLLAIGDLDSPKVRLPGGAGSAMVYLHCKRSALFMRHQSARSLVEKVDVITSPGGPPGPDRPGGPSVLVTDLAVFRYRPGEGLVLESVHPGVEPRELAEKTGWDLQVPDDTPVTNSPTPEVLDLIRGPIREKVARIYPLFAEKEM